MNVAIRRFALPALFGITALTLLAGSPVQAGPWRGDIRHFDYARWHGGRWVHDYYGGRLGWWWVVAGVWYFYPRPVYPYPDPYLPPEYVPVPAASATPGPAPAQYWYYCPGAQGYYPYVPACPGGWQKVPATPAAPPSR